MALIQTLSNRWAGHPELAVRDLILFLAVYAVLASLGWSFLRHHRGREIRKRRRSPVDTLSMTGFFVVFAWLLSREVGVMRGLPRWVELGALAVGLMLVMIGAWANVVGRYQLGRAWANQVTIYQRHDLRQQGLFRLVRHPLYASLIWMFMGAAIASLNWAGLLATCLVFYPAMLFRARQEEAWLLLEFPEYAQYCAKTGRFFPAPKLRGFL
jgi:protein-S-isoprenylcysteine O-methyltransferase Ste14